MAAESVTVTHDPDGKSTGTTTRASSNGAAAGGGVGAALAALIIWILAQGGIDAGGIEWAINVILSAAVAYAAARWAGHQTPTDQVREVERVAVQQVDATDPELKAAIVGIAAQAGLIPVEEAEQHMPDGTGSHRADAVAEPTVVDETEDDSPIVTETTVQVDEEDR